MCRFEVIKRLAGYSVLPKVGPGKLLSLSVEVLAWDRLQVVPLAMTMESAAQQGWCVKSKAAVLPSGLKARWALKSLL